MPSHQNKQQPLSTQESVSREGNATTGLIRFAGEGTSPKAGFWVGSGEPEIAKAGPSVADLLRVGVEIIL